MERMMKSPLVNTISKWMFRLYILWSICADITIIGGLVYYKKDDVNDYIMWKYGITAFTWIVFIVLFSIAYAQHFGDDIPLRTLGGLGTHIDHGPYGTRLRAINAGYQYEL